MLLRLLGKAQSSFNPQLAISQIIVMTYFPMNPLTYMDCVVGKVFKNASPLWAEHSYRSHPVGWGRLYWGEIQITETVCDLGFFRLQGTK